MRTKAFERIGRAVFAATLFASGYLCANLTDRPAEAQLGELGSKALERAGGVGGVATLTDLGTAIVEMEQHVSGLEKNIDTLKNVKSALGG